MFQFCLPNAVIGPETFASRCEQHATRFAGDAVVSSCSPYCTYVTLGITGKCFSGVGKISSFGHVLTSVLTSGKVIETSELMMLQILVSCLSVFPLRSVI